MNRNGSAGFDRARLACPPMFWGTCGRVFSKWTSPKSLPPEVFVSASMINRRDLFFVPDDFCRLHTNVTTLRRDLRAHLSVNGCRVVGCDIACAQPLIIGMLVLRNTLKGGAAHDRQRKRGERKTGRRKREQEENPYVAGVTAHKWGRIPPDLATWVQLREAGELYEHIQGKLGTGLDRDTVKRRTIVTLFDRLGHPNRIWRLLWAEFPTVMQAVTEIKMPDHCRMAQEAQRAEGRFVYGQVVRRLMRERPDLPVLTIHDSILGPEGSERYIREVMLDEFAVLGVQPTIRIEKT